MSRRISELPDPLAVRARFDLEALRYDQYAALEGEVGARLLERLSFRRRDPLRIIDLGSGTGNCTVALKCRFQDAEVIGLDASVSMSRILQRKSAPFNRLQAVCGDFSALPFTGRSADLVLSNLALQWCLDFPMLTQDLRRILRPGGLLLFSSLGPGSLPELKSAAGYGEQSGSVRNFVDMHDIGDALLAAGFSEPVMDSEYITLEYPTVESLIEELEATGADTHFADWLSRAAARNGLKEAYKKFRRNERYPVTWEVVYGTAFGPGEGQPVKTPEGDVAAFSVAYLRGSLAGK